MKSKVASRSICRAKSDRKIAAPLSTPTRMTDCPEKSFVIWAPSSPTRLAISCREISTLRSLMAFHIKLGGQISNTGRIGAFPELHRVRAAGKFRFEARSYSPDEFEGNQTDVVRTRDVSYRDS